MLTRYHQGSRMPEPSVEPETQTSSAHHWFTELANRASHAAGRATTFSLAVLVILVWAVSGPIFGFSDTWQLIINTGTTIVTFLMVFLIQNSQNRDNAAIQVKLDELIRTGHVRNTFVGIEHLSDDEIEELRRRTEARAQSEGAERAVRQIGDRARRAADTASRG